jgi:hypothetical protein
MESVDVDDPFHFTGSSYLSLVDIAMYMTDQCPISISSAKNGTETPSAIPSVVYCAAYR